jgi:hypothetical protein
MSNPDARFRRLIAKAEITNQRRDAIDHGAGFSAPNDPIKDDRITSREMLVRTALMALECAIKTNDWDCVAEAFVMLNEGIRPSVRYKAS